MKKYNKIQKLYEETIIDEMLNESTVYQVIDQFVRFLVGDRKVALRELEKLKKVSVPFAQPKSDKEYNDMYGKLFRGIQKAIEKNLPLI